MRRLVAIGCGLFAAVATAVLALPTSLFVAVLLRGDLSKLPPAMLDMVVVWAWTDGSGQLLHQAIDDACKATAVICCAPVILAALVGEAAGLRSVVWFVAATAGLSVVLPLAAGSGPLSALAQADVFAPLAETGAAAGLVYWLIAAQPLNRVPPPRITDQANRLKPFTDPLPPAC